MANDEIGYCDQYDVDADDDEGANRDVGDDGGFETVKNLTAIKYQYFFQFSLSLPRSFFR